MLKQKKVGSRILRRKVYKGVLYIKLGFNNTIVSVTDFKGNLISWSSSGLCGFKGSKKGTPFAAQVSTENALRKSLEYGIKQLEVILKGPGSGREMSLRSVQGFGLSIISIKDVSPLSHNGCRPSKRRRV